MTRDHKPIRAKADSPDKSSVPVWTGLLQRNAASQTVPITSTPVAHRVPDSPGQPLDADTRGFMEARFGHDFSRVRVHTDAEATRSASKERSAAYTVGRDIVFGQGRYSPQTNAGRKLLTHELVHVIQQDGLSHGDTLPENAVPGQAEAEAGRLSNLAETSTEPIEVQTRLAGGGLRLQRAPEDEAGVATEEEEAKPDHTTRSIIWFRLNSDRPREDSEVSSTTHLAIAVRRISEHAAVAADAQVITLYGYASSEGTESRNRALSEMRASRVREMLIDAGIPAERIITVGRGPDSTFPGLKWNRRVEIELEPSVGRIEFSEEEGEEVSGEAPRTGPKPLESTKDVLTPSHWALRDRPRIPTDPIHEWGTSEATAMWWERTWDAKGKSQTLLDYKDAWVRAHRNVIRQAAVENDLPDWFLAGVAWAELGGDPSFIDYLAHSYRRDIGIGSKPAEETSFGAVSMQVRRAAEELGYDPSRLTDMQTSFIIASLADPQQNLFIVASHLDRLRDQDFPGKPAELLTDEDLKIIGTRYNRGPDRSLEKIKANLSHGESIVNKKDRLQKLLAD